MNKIRKRITFLILIFVSFSLMADGCETDIVALILGAPAASQIAATQAALDSTEIAAVGRSLAAADAATQRSATQTEAARPKTPTPTFTPTATATATRTPTPQPATITVKVGEVAEFKTFNVIITKAEYVTPNPKGAYIITVSLENKTSTDLTYSINNFSVTNSAGKNTVLALPKPQGSTWSDDFLPNSSVPAGAKSTLQLLAQVLSGLEKDFVLGVNFGNFTALIPLGR